MFLSSKWVAMNVLVLDPGKIVVEAGEAELIALLESAGFTVVPVPFRHVNSFGGAFHCATSDVRRRGELPDYFSLPPARRGAPTTRPPPRRGTRRDGPCPEQPR